jgi:hypothetical protein
MFIPAKIPSKDMFFIPADQYTGLAGKIDPIEIQYIPWRSNNRRQCPYIPEL